MAWEALIEKMVQDSAPDCLEAWLRVVTYRKAVDHLRKRRSDLGRPLVDEVDGVGTVDDACDLASSREMVGTFLKRIEWRFGERSARIVACLWLEGLTHAAAAERVGVSTKRLRKILYGDGRKVGLRDELARLMEQFSASVDARPSTSRP
jgi:DNA-directed RNA polymerase specialized sigma24 family protein